MSSKILLFGKSGQVGGSLFDVFRVRENLCSPDRIACDFRKIAELRSTIREMKPDIIVNAAAYTSVDKAEMEENVCFQINAEAPGVIAEEAKRIGALLIHYSTAYVFDGSKSGAYVESDEPNALNVYGRSKLSGEGAIVAAGGRFIILRLNWVYSRLRRNFATDILRAAIEKQELAVVDDQVGAPTPAALVANVTSRLVDELNADTPDRGGSDRFGVYHLAPSGRVSRYAFAVDLVRRLRRSNAAARLHEDGIVAVSSKQFPALAARPANTAMDCGKIRKQFSVQLPDWKDGLTDFFEDLEGRGA